MVLTPRRSSALLLVTLAAGCGPTEDDGRAWMERVVYETPAVAQALFDLPSPPRSTYNENGRYPEWIAGVTTRRFSWRKNPDGTYTAEATVVARPGPGLDRDAGASSSTDAGVAARHAVTADITVSYSVRSTPPPVFFLPRGRALEATTWRLTRVDGRPSAARGPFVDYRMSP